MSRMDSSDRRMRSSLIRVANLGAATGSCPNQASRALVKHFKFSQLAGASVSLGLRGQPLDLFTFDVKRLPPLPDRG